MFKEFCEDYYSRGISVIPVRGKKVGVSNFGQYSHRLPTRTEIDLFKKNKPDLNIGLMLGRVNNLMCIDVDTDLKDVMELIENETPQTPVAKFGSKGITKFYRTTLNYNDSMCSFDHGCMLEFHGSSRQTVIPPSIHPTTKNSYVWVGGNLLDNYEDIPTISYRNLKNIRDYMVNKYNVIDMRTFLRKKRIQLANS
jgi:hypothetical protein